MSASGPFPTMEPAAWQDDEALSRARWARQRWRLLLTFSLGAGLLVLGFSFQGALFREGAAVAADSPTFTGQFLVATNELNDPRFVRTVVYMLQHNAGGAMGLIVNRPVGDVSVADLLEHLGLEGKGVAGKILVHYGGPVEPERGFVLHTAEYKIEGTQVVKEGIAVTSQPEILQAIGSGIGPRRSLLALGYAGWAPGQLEGEIKAGGWVVVPADEALVFDNNYAKKWERAMARRTINL